jgi:hypothetical protein
VPSNGKVSIPRRPVEVGSFFRQPHPGDRTASMRVLDQKYEERRLTLSLEGMAGSDAELLIVAAAPDLRLAVEGAELPVQSRTKTSIAAHEPSVMKVHFPEGEGWKTITVTLSW